MRLPIEEFQARSAAQPVEIWGITWDRDKGKWFVTLRDGSGREVPGGKKGFPDRKSAIKFLMRLIPEESQVRA